MLILGDIVLRYTYNASTCYTLELSEIMHVRIPTCAYNMKSLSEGTHCLTSSILHPSFVRSYSILVLKSIIFR